MFKIFWGDKYKPLSFAATHFRYLQAANNAYHIKIGVIGGHVGPFLGGFPFKGAKSRDIIGKISIKDLES